jgi:gamma-polyglutamate biosynthesis protein CapA
MRIDRKLSLLLLVGLSSAIFLAILPSFFFKEEEALYFKSPERSIVLMAVGDIMLDRGVAQKISKKGGGDFGFPFFRISDYLNKADIVFGNLESVISDKGKKVGSIYSFRAFPEAVEGLAYAGFDVLSVANNHAFDYGREAMEDSFKRLREREILYAGGGFTEEETRRGVIKEVKGTKISFLGYTNQGSPYWRAAEESSGVGWIGQEIVKDIKRAKERSDIVVASFHFGREYQKTPSESQKRFSYLAIDSGADLVLGHHPHVIQPVEKYKDGWIAYSLGNFVFDQYFSEETMEGLLLEVEIKEKKVKEVRLVEFKISEDYQPYFPL